jgi:EpsI family protein
VRAGAKIAVVSALLILTAVYVYLNPPERMALGSGSLARFPLELGDWSGVDRGFDDVVYEELSADATLVREYGRGDDLVWFVVIFHQNERYGAHEPVVCYRSQGWSIVDEGTRALHRPGDQFDANWLLVESRGETRLALYWWYTAGDLATGDRDQFFARMARSGIVSNVTFGAFVRVSTVVRNADIDGAFDTVTGFAEEALKQLPGLFELTGQE